MPHGDPEAAVRLLATIERLLQLPALDLGGTLTRAAQVVAEALACEKVDAFLFDAERHSLVAIGTSDTPLGREQHRLGLDVLPLANGGRAVETYLTGAVFSTGRADQDPHELRGLVHDLRARSVINVPFEVNEVRRGVLSAVSTIPDYFTARDVKMTEVVARWVGLLTQRAELVEKIRVTEAERARRAAADEIVTVLAHDLRNLLNPLLGRLHLIRLSLERGKPADVRDVDSALRAVKRLARLTTDLLDVGRLEQGLFTLDLAPTDLVALVEQTCASLATANVKVQVRAPPTLIVVADAERLAQALENLITNAVQHSSDGGAVHVSITLMNGSRVACLEIADQGPGIPEDVLPHIFERFVAGRKSRGLGLGLYLAHRIAAAHGGALTVRSELGQGTRFTLELPIDADPDERNHPVAGEP